MTPPMAGRVAAPFWNMDRETVVPPVAVDVCLATVPVEPPVVIAPDEVGLAALVVPEGVALGLEEPPELAPVVMAVVVAGLLLPPPPLPPPATHEQRAAAEARTALEPEEPQAELSEPPMELRTAAEFEHWHSKSCSEQPPMALAASAT